MDVHVRNMQARDARNRGNPVDGRNARYAIPSEERNAGNAGRSRNDNPSESPLQREQARRYVDRRERQQQRQQMGEVYELLFQTFLLCCFITLVTKTRQDSDDGGIFESSS